MKFHLCMIFFLSCFLSISSSSSSSSYRPATPLPCVGPLQIGLRIHCVRIGPSVGSEATGSDPPSGLTYRAGGFSHFSCPSLYVEAHEPSLTSRRLKLSLNYVLKLKSLPENPAYSCAFEPEKSSFLKSRSQKFHLSASAFYHTWRTPNLT